MGAVEEIRSFLVRFYAATGQRVEELVLREGPWKSVVGDVVRRANYKIGKDEVQADYTEISIAGPFGGFCKIKLHPDDDKALRRRIANACAEPQEG